MAAPRHSTDWEALSLRMVFGALAAVAVLSVIGRKSESYGGA